ncbi:hypothetical protein HOD05_03440 [Candidatus Woesearchaeota archaeon]|jgi:RNase P/RNase MRP subunit POP5|nr:hypothetical protein [Candidatus Woesearchaeota archaeon]MBT4150606.1 hypothetical protein [Candidatus Woesearchaeota archaeon]MBT4247824.1 hypothetical protein [Candidatus Woesearchaeota archaeon]MBT4434248.1 hypothetical protein [Candidatus Woesearchaeota archaeon]MBT7331831.1 hypothetical protein [Candidatus Woesearchaeota archaeon]
MSLKKLLGLEESDLSEREIMHKISEARNQNLGSVEFRSSKSHIVVKLSQVNPNGIMKGSHWNFYMK